MLARPRFLRGEDDLGYLLRALRNTFFNQRRTAGRRPRSDPLPESYDLPEQRPLAEPERALETKEVFAAIAALPDDFRDVVVAVDVAGLSYDEAARSLKIPQGTVMSRLYRGRQQVARRLAD